MVARVRSNFPKETFWYFGLLNTVGGLRERFGPFETRSEAQRVRSRMLALGGFGPISPVFSSKERYVSNVPAWMRKSAHSNPSRARRNPVEPTTVGGRELVAAGYTLEREVQTRRDLKKLPVRWYEVRTPNGEEVLILKQSPNAWHAFFTFEGTASGFSAASATRGGLGDAIGSDSQLRSYCRIVLRAPESLIRKYRGLSAAQSQCYAELHSDY